MNAVAKIEGKTKTLTDKLDFLLNHNTASYDIIPDINLYMDQILELLDTTLIHYKISDDDKIFTKTMINNYAKSKVIEPPIKKKYSKDNYMQLVIIYFCKQSLSIKDTKSFTELINSAYSLENGGLDNESIYKLFEKAESNAIYSTKTRFSEEFNSLKSERLSDISKTDLIMKLTIESAINKKIIEILLSE